MNKNITAMIMAINEGHRLPYVYENLKNFCNIIIFDGGSTDGTFEYCKKNNITFVSRPKVYENDAMGIDKFKWAFKQAETEYIMLVYCSHFYPQELLNTLSRIANENKLSAVYIDLIVYRYGQIVHKPFIRRIPSVCNFFKKSIITFENAKIHDELAITFDKANMVRLKANDELSMHLFQDDGCHKFTTKTVKYAALEAEQKFKSDKRVGLGGLLFKPLWRFFYAYFRTGAVIRGIPGLIYSILNLVYDFQVNIMIWELSHGLDLEGLIRKQGLVRSELNKELMNQ
jgi:glycosyltransferase involved in cell wall biosynthesis